MRNKVKILWRIDFHLFRLLSTEELTKMYTAQNRMKAFEINQIGKKLTCTIFALSGSYVIHFVGVSITLTYFKLIELAESFGSKLDFKRILNNGRHNFE